MPETDELSIYSGDIVKINNDYPNEPGWYYGQIRMRNGTICIDDQWGKFPALFVSIFEEDEATNLLNEKRDEFLYAED
ncbi:MAG: hypothetical protein MHPSP_002742, partial [Paramarteilia canceri]